MDSKLNVTKETKNKIRVDYEGKLSFKERLSFILKNQFAKSLKILRITFSTYSLTLLFYYISPIFARFYILPFFIK